MPSDAKSSKTLAAEVVTARLQALSDLSRDGAPPSRVDMSAAAITARLVEMSELSDLCARLGEIGRAARDQQSATSSQPITPSPPSEAPHGSDPQ